MAAVTIHSDFEAQENKICLKTKNNKKRKYNVRKYSVFTEKNEDYYKLVRRQFFSQYKEEITNKYNEHSFLLFVSSLRVFQVYDHNE